jgi:hypothetical protein
MSQSYFTMWSMLALMAFGALAGPLIHGNLLGSIRAAYPSDQAKRDALHRCGEMDNGFSRFTERDRDICYRAVLHLGDRTTASAAGD